MKPRIYLACPYWHNDPNIRESRVITATKAAGQLIYQGWTVFSPLTHSHLICQELGNCEDGDLWMEHALAFLDWAHTLGILRLEGWEESEGIAIEIAEWKKVRRKPVQYLTWQVDGRILVS